MPTITLDKIIFRNNDTYTKMYKGSELIAQVDSGGGYDYLTFTATQANSTVTFNSTWTSNYTVSYSTDNGSTWVSGNGVTVTLTNIGDKVKYKGIYTTARTATTTTPLFTLTGSISASGSIMSIMNESPDDTVINKNYAFNSCFYNQTALTNITNLKLPATGLYSNCYYYMFYGCTGITTVPNNLLPAPTLASYCYFGMFYGCTGITTVPSNLLPATTLAIYCYRLMFSYCSSLTTAPALPAKTALSSCYESMFSYCSSLTTAPELPAKTVSRNCYSTMFYGCTSLTTAPSLPATTLAENCYYSMFNDCSSLTSAPTLPATTLARSCYGSMFYGCTSLTTAPALPATTLARECYQYMFYGCTRLTTAPVLPATSMSASALRYCYRSMFNGCSRLNSITTYATSWSTTNASSWVSGVSSTGDFCNLGGASISTGTSGIPSGWTVHTIPIPVGYITLTNNGNTNTSVSVSDYNNAQYGRLLYSTDGTTWNWLTNTEVTIEPNNSLYIAGDKACSNSSTVSYNKLSITGGSVSASGNVRYLYECLSIAEGTMPAYALVKRFSGCTGITDISGLVFPNATSNYCYYEMFSGCTSLTTIISSLPATTLSNYCYGGMFKECTGITTAPELPSTSVGYGSYYSMFSGCISLNSQVTLPITYVDGYGMQYMFQNCSSFNYLDISSYNESSSNKFNDMLSGVNSTGDLYIGKRAKGYISQTNVPSGWTIHYSGNDWPCVVISAIDNTQSATIKIKGSSNPGNTSKVYYSTEGADEEKTEVTLSSGSYTNIVIPANKKLYIYGSIYGYTGSYTKSNQANFYGTDLVRIESGTLKRLTNYTESESTSISVAGYLFADWTGLVSVPADFLPYPNLKIYGGYGVYRGLFKNCTNLTTLPNLPATDLGTESSSSASYCYYEMFSGCTSLTSIPSNYLPATTLSNYVYQSMFQGCTGLTSVPSNLLPATTLKISCYQSMFQGCTGLTSVPSNLLPVTTLSDSCYRSMFQGCTNLTNTPDLVATTLAGSCYNGMFYGCTSLTTAYNSLPATTLYSYSYNDMFRNCTSLTTAPEIYAEHSSSSSATQPMSNMFNGCSRLNSITTHTTTWNTNLTPEWVLGVAATGDFYNLGDATIPTGISGIPSGWTEHIFTPVGYVTLTNNGNTNTSVSVSNYNNKQYGRLVYSTDGNNWDWLTNTAVTIEPNNNLYIAGDKAASDSTTIAYNNLSITGGSVSASGNVRYLYECTSETAGTMPDYALTGRFMDCTGITDISGLIFPSTTSNYCFTGMFRDTSITSLPSGFLPATSVATYAYAQMFNGCSSLTTIPTDLLSGKTASSYSFYCMFYNCTSLTVASNITSNASHSSDSMYKGCTSLVTAPSLGSGGSTSSYCFASMFEGCTSLTTVSSYTHGTWNGMGDHVYYRAYYGCTSLTGISYFNQFLPYSAIGSNAFEKCFMNCTGLTYVSSNQMSNSQSPGASAFASMFEGCTNLVSARLGEMFTTSPVPTTLSNSLFYRMFYGCSKLQYFSLNIQSGVTTAGDNTFQYMFNDCFALTSGLNLRMTTLGSNCCSYMYNNCRALATTPLLEATTLGSSCCEGMFEGCSSLTTAPVLNATTLSYNCYLYMFYDCTNLASVTTYATTWNTSYTDSWLYGVAATGDFYNFGGATIPTGISGIPSGWTEYTPTPSTPVPTSVSIFNQFNDGTTPSTNYGTLTENTNDYTYSQIGNSYSDLWSGVDIMLPYDCSSFTYHIVASIPGGATSGVNVVAPNANGNPTNQMSNGSTSFDSDITVTRPSSATQGNDWRLRTYIKRDGSKSDLTPITVTIPKSTI